MSTLREIQRRLIQMHNHSEMSWREIAEMPEYQGINHATISAIARGRDPKNLHIRQILGLPLPTAYITVVIGHVPEGSMSLGAWRCDCGQWFIPNHPARRRCFICRPYKGKRKAREGT